MHLVTEQSRMICSNPNKVSQGECIKQISCCFTSCTYQVSFCRSTNSLHALQLPNISNTFALHQPYTLQVNYFTMNCSKEISQHTLHLPCLMKQGPCMLCIFFLVSRQTHMSTRQDILINDTFWRKGSTSAVS